MCRIIDVMADKNYKSPIITLDEYNKLSQHLLYKVHSIYTIDHINMWKSDAQILVYKYTMLLNDFDREIDTLTYIYQKEDKEFQSQNILLRLLGSNPAEKIKFKIESMKSSITQIKEVISKLEYWIRISPDSIQDAIDLSLDLKLYKNELIQQFDLVSSKDFDVEKYNLSNRRNCTFDKYHRLQKTFRNYIKQTNATSIAEAKNSIQKLIRIVDETINWYQQFIRRNQM